MPAEYAIRRRPLVMVIVVVCVVGTLVGALFGTVAGLAYELPFQSSWYYITMSGNSADPAVFSRVSLEYRVFASIGLVAGASAGLAAGVLWCSVAIRLAARGRRERMGSHGAWIGVLAGVLATMILHTILGYAAWKPEVAAMVIGLICGVVAGASAGAVCGAMCKRVVVPAGGNGIAACRSQIAER